MLLFSGLAVSAQNPIEDIPPYKKDLHIPEFSVLQIDSSWFTREMIPKSDFTAIIYFAPDCGHCQYTVKELVKNMDSLTNVFFLFVAYKPLQEIREFYTHYGLDKFNNVRMSRDPKYFIPAFYRVTSTPFVALYNKLGMLDRVFDPALNTTVEIPDLVAHVRKN